MSNRHLTTTSHLSGFTLLELLLYIAIVATVVTVVGNILASNQRLSAKAAAISTVSESGMQLLNTIENYLVSADVVSIPAAGTTGNSLELVTDAGEQVVISWTNGVMYINVNNTGSERLSSNMVNIDNVSFNHLTNSDFSSVQIRAEISTLNTSGRQEYDFASSYYSTISIR